jgi:elongation factor G
MTSGAGTFTRSFNRYDPMPPHLAEAVRKAPRADLGHVGAS